MKYIYETAAQTAKKIRKTLKEAFPSVKFSVRSDTYSMGSSVDVYWTDGPLASDVDTVLNRFSSGHFDGMQDMYVSTGYNWEGQVFHGAKYLSSHRSLSDDRRSIIKEYLSNHYEPDRFGDYKVYQWGEAEQALIDTQQLQGYPSKLTEQPPVADSIDVTPQKTESSLASGSNVIPFPIKRNHSLSALDPEQMLKLEILRAILKDQDLEKELLNVSVDELFKRVAAEFFA